MAYVIGYGLNQLERPYDWRTQLGVGAAPAVVLLIFALIAPESTVWRSRRVSVATC